MIGDEDDFWRVNQYALEQERLRKTERSDPNKQANDACKRIANSVNNSRESNEPSLFCTEAILIGAILLGKFILFLLYRKAQQIDVDVSGI